MYYCAICELCIRPSEDWLGGDRSKRTVFDYYKGIIVNYHRHRTVQIPYIFARIAAPPNNAPMATPAVCSGAAAPVRNIEERASLLIELALDATELVSRPISDVMLERSAPVAVASSDVRRLSSELPCE